MNGQNYAPGIETPRKPPTKRLFNGLAGSSLTTVVEPEPATAKVGRPKKWESDAARKRAERAEKKAQEIIAEHPDERGRIHGESSGGFGTSEIDTMDAAQRSDAAGLGTDNATDEYGGTIERGVPDRRHVSVPAGNPDEQEPTKEYDNTWIDNSWRRSAASLRKWIYEGSRTPVKKFCAFKSEHKRWAEEQKHSMRKVYCGRCGKLLVNPGKRVKGLEFPDATPQTPAEGATP